MEKIHYLVEDNPELWEKVKDHGIDMPDDWQGEFPLYCKKCGAEAIQKMNLLWVCPVQCDIPDKYLHPA